MDKSVVVTGKDTVSSDFIELKQEGPAIWYTVKGQNNNQPLKFKLTLSTRHQLVFENRQHDFPQKIPYTLENKDWLVAEISGNVNGQPRTSKFPMRRVNIM